MVKDLFHGEAGKRCGNGSRLSADWVVSLDTAFYDRIRRSGLVNLGRTTTSEFGIIGTTETLAAGLTCTPWSAAHSAGGSSGGAAAVVGAGIVPVASASDGGGSIRIPAASCGVVGLKTSRGRVTWGPQIAEALAGWAVHFMVSRAVRDTAAMLDALAGPAYGDPFVIPGPARPFLEEVGAAVDPLRIAYWSTPWSGHDADPEVAAATEATAQLLESLGHHVEQATPTVRVGTVPARDDRRLGGRQRAHHRQSLGLPRQDRRTRTRSRARPSQPSSTGAPSPPGSCSTRWGRPTISPASWGGSSRRTTCCSPPRLGDSLPR